MKQKRWISAFLTLALSLALVVGVWAVVIPETTQDYVNDLVGFLTDEDWEIMEYNAQELMDATGIELMMVTMDYVGDQTFEEFGYQLFDQWEVSSNGLLICIFVGDDAFWGTPGIDMTLSNSRITEILYEYMAEDEDFNSTGARNAYAAYVRELGGTWSSSIPLEGAGVVDNTPAPAPQGGGYGYDPYYDNYYDEYWGPSPAAVIGGILVTVFVIVLIVSIISSSRRRTMGGGTVVGVPPVVVIPPRRRYWYRPWSWHYPRAPRPPRHYHRPPPPPRPPMGGGPRPPMGGGGAAPRPPAGGGSVGGNRPSGGSFGGSKPSIGGNRSASPGGMSRGGGGGGSRSSGFGGGGRSGGMGGGSRGGGGGGSRGGGGGGRR